MDLWESRSGERVKRGLPEKVLDQPSSSQAPRAIYHLTSTRKTSLAQVACEDQTDLCPISEPSPLIKNMGKTFLTKEKKRCFNAPWGIELFIKKKKNAK